MNVGSLFTGCLGLDLGLENAGFRTIWACEADKACQRVIGRYHPGLPIIPDVREVDVGLPRVDILAGGFPCQDLSYAGPAVSLGLDGARSGLWHEFARAIRLLRPPYVLVENVPGLATRGLGRVLYDLAEAGYVGSWIRLFASSVGAPHSRERIFIFASDASGTRRREITRSAQTDESQPIGRPANPDNVAVGVSPSRIRAAARAASTDTDCVGGERNGSARDWRRRSKDSHSLQVWGAYEPAIRRWEQLTRPSPPPVDDRGRLSPRFVEWMMGFPDDWTAGESRGARLRMLGNSVQVQCAELIGTQLLSHIKQEVPV